MFFDRSNHSSYALLAVLIVMFPAHGNDASASESRPVAKCVHALPITLDGIVSGAFYEPASRLVFYSDLPAAGILTLEVSTDGPPELRPELGFLGRDCGQSGGGRDTAVIEKSAGRRVIASGSAGRLYFAVTAEDPRQAPATVRLTSRFAGLEAVHTAIHPGPAISPSPIVVWQTDFYPVAGRKSQGEEVAPDPDPRHAREPILTLLAARVSSPRKSQPEEVDPDPERIAGPGPSAQLVLLPRAGVPAKSEAEEVDPDPDKSARLASRSFDGVLRVGAAAGGGSGGRQALVSLRATGVESSASSPTAWREGVIEWLARVLEVEAAWSRLVAPGAGDGRLRVLEAELGS